MPLSFPRVGDSAFPIIPHSLLARPWRDSRPAAAPEVLHRLNWSAAVSGEDHGIQFLVREIQPGGAGVVEVGERALL